MTINILYTDSEEFEMFWIYQYELKMRAPVGVLGCEFGG